MKAKMGTRGERDEADAEFWRAYKESIVPVDTVVMKRIPSPWAPRSDPWSDRFWILDGKMTTASVIARNMIWHPPGGRPSVLYQKLKGTHALDICSSYGCSSRAFLARHETVDVIEFEDWYARIVNSNVKTWGLTDRIRVAHTRDLTHIDFTAYDSVRFGIKQIEYLFWQHTDEFLKMNTLCFEFQTNNVIVDTLYKQGYHKTLGYKNCDVFTKHK